jgi:DNA-directed RNA polymerase subunit RPC12/RpoP
MSGSARIAISKKTRFEVFKRDGFVCQYCGATPPKIVLHVDHILPVKEGGKNNIDNLVTSCEPCNLGKGATLLTSVPRSLRDKALEVQEREDQLKGYNEILQARAMRIESDAWDVAAALEGKEFVETFNRANLMSIKRFLDRLPTAVVIDAAEQALAKFTYSSKKTFSYFCGICWARIRESE